MAITPIPNTTLTPSQPSPSTTSSPPQCLSLPPQTYAKLQPTSFLSAHLPSTRPSGRSPLESRPPTLHTNSLTHAHGSAVVRIGDTAVVCGVRGEILLAGDTFIPTSRLDKGRKDGEVIADLGLLVPNIELATGCNPRFLPGQAPSSEAQGVVQRVITLLRGTDLVGLGGLRIWDRGPEEGKGGGEEEMDTGEDEEEAQTQAQEEDKVMAYWTLYIDVLVISLDGAVFDAAWLAVLAALKATRLPAARWDRDLENVLCDPRRENELSLEMRGLPVPLSFVVFQPRSRPREERRDRVVLVDPDDFEEGCCDEEGTIVVDEAGARICRIECAGGSGLGVKGVRAMVERAGERWKEWMSLLKTIQS